jgi:multidrug efflux pump subunit AcrA (membrane-fusion protein)
MLSLLFESGRVRLRRLLGAMVLGGLWTVAFAGCERAVATSQPPGPPKVTVGHPELRTIVDEDEYGGWLRAAKTVEVRSRVRGHIDTVHFQDGDFVDKGQLLFELDPRPFQVQIDESVAAANALKAQQNAAEKELARNRELARKGAVTQQELEKSEADALAFAARYYAALQQAERFKLDLLYARIVAAIPGRIGRAQLTEGNLVNAGGADPLLATIVSTDPMHVSFTIDERALQRYQRLRAEQAASESTTPAASDLRAPSEAQSASDSRAPSDAAAAVPPVAGNAADSVTSPATSPGTTPAPPPATTAGAAPATANGNAEQRPPGATEPPGAPRIPRPSIRDRRLAFRFALDSDDGFPHEGLIDFTENQVDSTTGTIEVRGIADNLAGTLVAGSRVRVRVAVGDPYSALVVPDSAILADQERRYLLVVGADNVVARHDILPGRLLDDGFRIVRSAPSNSKPLGNEDRIITLGLQRARVNYPVDPQ